MIKTMEWKDDQLILIDQTKLPLSLEYITCKNFERVVEAIKKLEVRGAPAIGVAGAFALVLAAKQITKTSSRKDFIVNLKKAKDIISKARPTAINLVWALDYIWEKAVRQTPDNLIINKLEEIAKELYENDIKTNKLIGKFGANIITKKISILTHCNAGALATCGWGTALGVIREAHAQNKVKKVFVDETRPLLQGSRITAWELITDKIPATLITDSTAGWAMKKNLVDLVITGADRIALNGDTANKIGTYSLAILAKEHDIPFYIAAPKSTIDFSINSGYEIPIEERDKNEVLSFCNIQSAPQDIEVFNPSFDVTPNNLITGIITEYGVLYPPYSLNINKLK